MVLLSYSYDTLVIGLALQSALTDWWCLHRIPKPADSSVYTMQTRFFAYLALHSLCTTLRTLLHTSVHLCPPPCTSMHLHPPLHTPSQLFHFTFQHYPP